MYRGFPTPGELPRSRMPFGHPPPRGPPSVPNFGGPFGPPPNVNVPPPGHLAPASCGSFLPPGSNSHYLHSRPVGDHFIDTRPHCSNFSIDRSTVISLGSQQIIPHAEPQLLQIPQWNPLPVEHPKDNSEKAGEEFLRCLAANQPLPDYLKGDMVHNLADAFKSANALKAAVPSDFDFLKHTARSKSRCRSKSRAKSRARSRSRSRAKSRAKSKSRAQSRSRGKSRARSKSKARSRSRSRGRSRAQSRGRSRGHRSRSRSRGKSHAREHRSKRSPSQGCSGSSHASTGNNTLLKGLKQVMNSKELEDRLPSLKDAILTIQASSQGMDGKMDSLPCEQEPQQDRSSTSYEQELVRQTENDSMLLPHDRVGSDFSWIQASSQEDSAPVQRTVDLDDEEFLYGNGDFKDKQPATAATFTPLSQSQGHSTPQRRQLEPSPAGSQPYSQNKPMFSNLGDLLDLKQSLQTVSPSPSAPKREHTFQQEPASHTPDVKECEMIKCMLKNMGLNLDTADISKMMVKLQEQKEGKQPSLGPGAAPTTPALVTSALGQTNVRQALESLQSLIKATKEKRAKSDPHSTSYSQNTSEKHKVGEDEESNKREKQARKQKKETLVKELEVLLKDDGSDFLIPVIGFYCMKCEEFMGDLNTAESHAAVHHRNDSSTQKCTDGRTGQDKGHSHHHSSSSTSSRHERPIRPPDKRDQKYSNHQRDTRESRDYQDHHRDDRGHRDPRDERQHGHMDLKRKLDEDPRGHRNGRDKMYLKEEMMKERLLITVSRGLTPSPNIRVKEEMDEVRMDRGSASTGPAMGKHGKIQQDSKGKPWKKDSDKEKDNDKDDHDSSDSSDDEKGKSSKGKSQKKKKKDKKKKDKKEKKKKKEKGKKS